MTRKPARPSLRRLATAVAVRAGPAVVSAGLMACGPVGAAEHAALDLGYLPNVTHAPAIVGIEGGYLAAALGDDVTLREHAFNAGPDAVAALLSGAIDAAYIGPNPAINAYARSDGQALRIVAGATSGGAALVVRPGIAGPHELAGATLSTPQLGNTQDVALRTWLRDQGLEATLAGGGDVSVQPQAPAHILETFVAGDIDGAWVPEPWVTRLTREADGHVLVDERDLWRDGRFVTTHLVVRTQLLDERSDVVRDLLAGHLDALAAIEHDPEAARGTVGAFIDGLTGSAIGADVLADAWANLTFTADPVATSLQEAADHAQTVGLLDAVDLGGIHELSVLNQLLAERGEPEVAS